jgi:hypothetical protein
MSMSLRGTSHSVFKLQHAESIAISPPLAPNALPSDKKGEKEHFQNTNSRDYDERIKFLENLLQSTISTMQYPRPKQSSPPSPKITDTSSLEKSLQHLIERVISKHYPTHQDHIEVL